MYERLAFVSAVYFYSYTTGILFRRGQHKSLDINHLNGKQAPVKTAAMQSESTNSIINLLRDTIHFLHTVHSGLRS